MVTLTRMNEMTEEEFKKYIKKQKNIDSALTIACVITFVVCMAIFIITGFVGL